MASKTWKTFISDDRNATMYIVLAYPKQSAGLGYFN